jgi:hypothetical protein
MAPMSFPPPRIIAEGLAVSLRQLQIQRLHTEIFGFVDCLLVRYDTITVNNNTVWHASLDSRLRKLLVRSYIQAGRCSALQNFQSPRRSFIIDRWYFLYAGPIRAHHQVANVSLDIFS